MIISTWETIRAAFHRPCTKISQGRSSALYSCVVIMQLGTVLHIQAHQSYSLSECPEHDVYQSSVVINVENGGIHVHHVGISWSYHDCTAWWQMSIDNLGVILAVVRRGIADRAGTASSWTHPVLTRWREALGK
jgi:hypothetical protein